MLELLSLNHTPTTDLFYHDQKIWWFSVNFIIYVDVEVSITITMNMKIDIYEKKNRNTLISLIR